MIKRHNVFITYYHDQDQRAKDQFVHMMGDNIVDMSVDIGDIPDTNQPTEATLQRIREDYIAQASVTVVLIGRCTWQRKYVDWEIAASLRETQTNLRCGLLGILLPGHPDFERECYLRRLIPPRLAANCDGDESFASAYDWSSEPSKIRDWIHRAFLRRRRQPDPDNSYPLFADNRHTDCSRGWQS